MQVGRWSSSEAGIAERSTREEYLLFGRGDTAAKNGKDLPSHGPGSENIRVSLQDFAYADTDPVHTIAVIRPEWLAPVDIEPPVSGNNVQNGLAGAACGRKQTRFVNTHDTPSSLFAANVWHIRNPRVS